MARVSCSEPAPYRINELLLKCWSTRAWYNTQSAIYCYIIAVWSPAGAVATSVPIPIAMMITLTADWTYETASFLIIILFQGESRYCRVRTPRLQSQSFNYIPAESACDLISLHRDVFVNPVKSCQWTAIFQVNLCHNKIFLLINVVALNLTYLYRISTRFVWCSSNIFRQLFPERAMFASNSPNMCC